MAPEPNPPRVVAAVRGSPSGAPQAADVPGDAYRNGTDKGCVTVRQLVLGSVNRDSRREGSERECAAGREGYWR
ncbi:hypothetical protein Nans01_34860 [Nocardiopsis ansamitocini]|uniref:Uncharacterized protein n=1 Tax=Nocardiopsis ansamitocini TaxID=1670832 RepID=A0A9W6P7V8_9ACTN|nr:hypothetical protein Nans01_34860 [Nocardiopsis ansamitocini]